MRPDTRKPASRPARPLPPHARRTGRGGFTLVEVLVVIAIIAVLTAIIFPVAGKMQQRALDTKCVGNQREIGRLFPQYATDNNGLYPFAYRADGEEGIEMWSVDLLAPYVYPEILDEAYEEKYAFREESIFRCPAAKEDLRKRGKKFIQDKRLGYGMNESLPGRGSAQDRHQAYSMKMPGKIEVPSQACLIMDASDAVISGSSRNKVKEVIGRHDGKVCVLYFDGSNAVLKFSDIPWGGGGAPGSNNEVNRFWFGVN